MSLEVDCSILDWRVVKVVVTAAAAVLIIEMVEIVFYYFHQLVQGCQNPSPGARCGLRQVSMLPAGSSCHVAQRQALQSCKSSAQLPGPPEHHREWISLSFLKRETAGAGCCKTKASMGATSMRMLWTECKIFCLSSFFESAYELVRTSICVRKCL